MREDGTQSLKEYLNDKGFHHREQLKISTKGRQLIDGFINAMLHTQRARQQALERYIATLERDGRYAAGIIEKSLEIFEHEGIEAPEYVTEARKWLDN